MKIPVENDARVRPYNLPEESEADAKAAAKADKKPGLGQEPPRISRTDGSAQAAGTSTLGRASLFEPGPLPRSTTQVDSSQLQATTDRLAKLHESTTIFDIFAVMALICLVTLQQRDSSRQTARVALAAQVEQINNQAAKMRESADKAHTGAVINAALTIASGIASMAFAGAALKGFNMDYAKLFSGATSDVLKGSGELAKADFDRKAQYKQAEVKEHEAGAMKAAADREEALKMRDAMYENLSSTLAAMRQILQSREQTTARIFA